MSVSKLKVSLQFIETPLVCMYVYLFMKRLMSTCDVNQTTQNSSLSLHQHYVNGVQVLLTARVLSNQTLKCVQRYLLH